MQASSTRRGVAAHHDAQGVRMARIPLQGAYTSIFEFLFTAGWCRAGPAVLCLGKPARRREARVGIKLDTSVAAGGLISSTAAVLMAQSTSVHALTTAYPWPFYLLVRSPAAARFIALHAHKRLKPY